MRTLYELSQELRPEIESSDKLMAALRSYAKFDLEDRHAHDLPIPRLGAGENNAHFDLGVLRSGLPLAIRENHILYDSGKQQRNIAEHYAQDLEVAREEGKTTHKVCVAIKATPVDTDEWAERYFVIVQNLQDSGEFVPAAPEQEFGFLNGEPIWYDFPDQSYGIEPLFTADEAVIHVEGLG